MKNNKGFTLVELIIVIAILAVIAGIALPLMINNLKSSRLTTDIANAEILARTAVGVATEDEYSLVEGAEYVFGTSGAAITPYEGAVIAAMHNKIPAIRSQLSVTFKIKITSGAVIVLDSSNREIYPTPDTVYQ